LVQIALYLEKELILFVENVGDLIGIITVHGRVHPKLPPAATV